MPYSILDPRSASRQRLQLETKKDAFRRRKCSLRIIHPLRAARFPLSFGHNAVRAGEPGPRCRGGGGLPVCHPGGFRVARFDAGVESGFILVADGGLRRDDGAHSGDNRRESGIKTNGYFRCGCFRYTRHTSIHSIGNAKRGL